MCLSVLGNLTNACLILDACLIIEVATKTGFTVLLSQFVCVCGGGGGGGGGASGGACKNCRRVVGAQVLLEFMCTNAVVSYILRGYKTVK